MKQTKNVLSTKSWLFSVWMSFTIQLLFNFNLFWSFLHWANFHSLCKMLSVEVINYQLREFQMLGRKTQQSSQQAGLLLITGRHQIKTNSHNFMCDSESLIVSHGLSLR
jgi:hypothetical protein